VTHLAPFVTDQGLSPVTAGNILAWFGLMSMVGLLAAGAAADMIEIKIILILTFLLRVVLFILVLVYQHIGSYYVFALLFGFTLSITAPLTPVLLGKIYGSTHLGIVTGFITTFHHIGGGWWSFMGGVMYDRMGDYRLAFMLSAMMALIAVLASIFIKEKRHGQWR
jgi:predicted MFS family arabinose efflux permease